MVETKLATLFIRYYAYVRKVKNVDNDVKLFIDDDYNDIQEALLMFLLHLAENDAREPKTSEEIEKDLQNMIVDKYDEKIDKTEFDAKDEVFKLTDESKQIEQIPLD